MSVGTELSKVDKLRIAGAMAPAVRRGNAKRVTLVDKAGKPVRQVTFDEIQVALLKREEIEFSLRDDAPQTVCAGWEGPCPHGAKPSKTSFDAGPVRRRKGEPFRCRGCASRKAKSAMTEDRKRAIARKAHSAMTKEARHERAVKTNSAQARSAKSARMLGELATMSKEQKAARMQAARDGITTEQRRASALKAWETKRAKAGQ